MGNKIDQLYFKTFDQIKDEKFDYIVIGGGAYGTSFSHRMLELAPQARILILEKGDYLIPEHIQNLPSTYIKLNSTTGVRPWVFEGPKNLNFMPQIPFVGGRALYWNAWVPQPDSTELIDWPEEAIDDLRDEWYDAGEFIGRRYSLATPGNQNQTLGELMRNRLFAGLKDIDGVTPQGNPFNLDSPMAVGHDQPVEGFAKFSPIPTLIQDVQLYPNNLSVAVSSEVLSLVADGNTITSIETVAGCLPCNGAKVILACNTLEAGFLLARSFPENPLFGKNLCGHIRSFLAVRIPAQAVPALTNGLQVTGYYVPGKSPDGRLFHTHVSVVHNPHPKSSLEVLYRVLPDASTVEALATYQDPNYVVIMLHTMGEILGTRSAESPNYVGFKDGNNLVHMEMQASDEVFWSFMDQVCYQAVNVLTANAPIEYENTNAEGMPVWQSIPPQSIRNSGMVHEAGTLWMGTDPTTSVTDTSGKMHAYDNVFALGSMTFPRPGSFNPTLTGIAQAFALAKHLAT